MGFTPQVPVTRPMHILLHSVEQLLLSLEHVSFIVIPVHEEKHILVRSCSGIVFYYLSSMATNSE